MENQNNSTNEIVVSASVKRKPRFKAGSDLSSTVSVSKIEIEVEDTSTEDAENYFVSLTIKNDSE